MSRYICVFTLLFSFAVHAENHSSDFWEVDKVEVRSVPDFGGVNILVENECEMDAQLAQQAHPSLNLGDISWDQIVNIGLKFWELVQDNKPVVTTETPTAFAMPKGLKCWNELERWNVPKTQTYEVLYKNKLGMQVVLFKFRLQFTYGGTNRVGLGRYIANATVLPSQLDVIWGYKFNARLDVGRAVNLRTHDDPIAGLEMNLHWNVKTWVKESENSVQFFISGLGDVTFSQ